MRSLQPPVRRPNITVAIGKLDLSPSSSSSSSRAQSRASSGSTAAAVTLPAGPSKPISYQQQVAREGARDGPSSVMSDDHTSPGHLLRQPSMTARPGPAGRCPLHLLIGPTSCQMRMGQ